MDCPDITYNEPFPIYAETNNSYPYTYYTYDIFYEPPVVYAPSVRYTRRNERYSTKNKKPKSSKGMYRMQRKLC